MLTLVILGRPNVGKSTLFNRLTSGSGALVHDAPGLTRDWRQAEGHIGPLSFHILDTAGLDDAPEGSLSARMSAQSQTALDNANAALFVVDGRAGITPQDRHFAQRVRVSGKAVVCVVNKCEGGKGQETVAEAYQLGFGTPVTLSAEHGLGLSELYEALVPLAQEFADVEPEPTEIPVEETEPAIHIAIAGRPNVGKSTLFNYLLGFERTLTGAEAGITRDSIAVDLAYGGRVVKLVDTAGIRRKAAAGETVEKLAVGDSLRTIQYAEVVILVLDAEYALEKQDLTLADHIEKEGRAVVIALNKWDKVENKQKYLSDFHELLEKTMPQVEGVAVQPICAERGTHVDKLMKAVFATHEAWNRRIPTPKLNDWLAEATSRHSPPIMNGRRIRLRYMAQTKTRPPTFVLFASKADKLPGSYQRYLVNALRKVFDLPGVPIRIQLKKNKNPYHKAK